MIPDAKWKLTALPNVAYLAAVRPYWAALPSPPPAVPVSRELDVSVGAIEAFLGVFLLPKLLWDCSKLWHGHQFPRGVEGNPPDSLVRAPGGDCSPSPAQKLSPSSLAPAFCWR